MLAGYLASALSVALFVWFLFLFVDMMMDYIRMSAKFRAWGAMMAMVFIVLGGFIFIIFVVLDFPKNAKKGRLGRRVPTVLAIQFLLFVLMEGARLLLFLPVFRAAAFSLRLFWAPVNYINAVGGFGLAAACLVAVSMTKKRKESIS